MGLLGWIKAFGNTFFQRLYSIHFMICISLLFLTLLAFPSPNGTRACCQIVNLELEDTKMLQGSSSEIEFILKM
jgi:hypothetical protein